MTQGLEEVKASFTPEKMVFVLTLMANRAEAVKKARTPVVGTKDTVGRNDPRPYGSGKKYKKCHLR